MLLLLNRRFPIRLEATWSSAAAARVVALLLGAAALLFPASAWAQQPGIDDEDPDQGLCDQSVELVAGLKTTGAYLPGATIGIQADPLLIRLQSPSPGNPRVCGVGTRPVPTGNWSWRIVGRPLFSTSQLSGTGRSVTLLLDRAGVYRIQFTACASGCPITLPDQTTTTVGPENREVMVRVVSILPPEKSPVLGPTALRSTSHTAVDNHCGFWSDKLDPAWYTVLPWSGFSGYKLLEGEVVRSSVAHADNGLNHDSQDWGFDVIPDPWHRDRLNLGQDKMEVEWERAQLPERYRPTEHDRISAIGYWVYDCGHGAPTEIHPPVLLAVHRPRAIKLPDSFGTNAYVPGIITDVFVNTEAGDTTNGCHATGLHQQIHPTKPVVDAQGRPIIRCLPDSEGFSSNPINGVFEFNIYLPRSPQAVMAAIGKTAPPVPLHREVNGSGNFQPLIQTVTDGNVTFLKVTIDLRGYEGPRYSRRIFAGWAHAAPDNWGARRWTVRVKSLDISDDADSALRGDGDWRFWVNTNSAANAEVVAEWTKIFDCDGCAHGHETLNLQPRDVVLFPNQNIWLATSGFEDDWTIEDSISAVHLSLPQAQIENGRTEARDGDAKYTMFYDVLPGTAIPPAQLSAEARARYDAYRLVNNDLRGLGSGTLAELEASFSSGTSGPGRVTVRPIATRQREPQSFEEMKVEQFREFIQRAQRERPAQLDAFFRDFKRMIERGKRARQDAEVRQFLEALKPAVPAELWRKHGLEEQLRVLRRN